MNQNRMDYASRVMVSILLLAIGAIFDKYMITQSQAPGVSPSYQAIGMVFTCILSLGILVGIVFLLTYRK